MVQRNLRLTAMHLLVVERAEAANGGHKRGMDGQFGRYVVITGRVLTEVLLQLELSLQHLLTLFFKHQFSVVLVFKQLLVQNANEAILVISDVLTHLLLCVA